MVTIASRMMHAMLPAISLLILCAAVSLLLLLQASELRPCSSDLPNEVTGFVLRGSLAPGYPQGRVDTWARNSSDSPDDEDYDEDYLEPLLSENRGCRPWGSTCFRLRPSRRNYGVPDCVQPRVSGSSPAVWPIGAQSRSFSRHSPPFDE